MNLKRPKFISILGVFILFISCNQEGISTHDYQEVERIKSEIKKDIDFNHIISKNIRFTETIFEKLRENKFLGKKNFSLKNLDEKQILVKLGMDKIFENHLNEINQHILAIKSRYPNINILAEDDLLPIYEKVKESIKPNLNGNLIRRVDPCDEAFESDFHTIHANYDTAVTWCTLLSVLSLGVASPCYLYAYGNMITDVVISIEKFANCKENL